MMLTRPERRLAAAMRLFVALFLFATILYGLSPFVGPLQSFSRRLPFVAYSAVKVLTLALVCMYAAGSPRERRGLAWVAIGGHLISVGAMILVLVFGDASRIVGFGPWQIPASRVLFGAIALDGVITLLWIWLALTARSAAREATAKDPAPQPRASLPAEAQLRVVLLALGVLFALGAVGYGLGAILPAGRDAFIELTFVTNAVVRVGTMALVAFYVAGAIVPRLGVTSILIWGHAASAVIQLLYWLGAANEAPMVILGYTIPIRIHLLLGAARDAAVTLVLSVMLMRAYKARYEPQYLNLRMYRTLAALGEVLVIGPNEQVPVDAMAENVDKYLSQIHSRRRIVHRLALMIVHFHPVLYLKPPLPELDPISRTEHLKQHFFTDVSARVLPEWWRRWVAGLIKVAKQLTYLGYYNDPRADKSVGYVRYKDRPRAQPLPPKHTVDLKVTQPHDVKRLREDVDVCVIGSGAAGAVLAYRMAEHNHSVLILERGKFVQPGDFSDNEVEMIGQLYDDGVFQQTRDLRFTILQGSCVGGSTVVNNAVSFRTPKPVVDNWNDPFRWNAGISFNELMNSAKRIEDWLPIRSQQLGKLNPSGRYYVQGVQQLGLPLQVDAVDANIRLPDPLVHNSGCVGCGYCNMGCAYGHKLSMLETVLPQSQQKFGDRVRIIARCSVKRLVEGPRENGGRRVSQIEAELSDGRTLTVRARKVIVSAGAIASSYLLQQSDIGNGLPVGEGMCFNMGAALTADFGRPLEAYDGLQISHFGVPPVGRGWVFETWWNPPVAQALNMPGWFEQHYDNMRHYNDMMAVGVLVGTESTGTVTSALLGGADVIYAPSLADRRKLADGLIELGEILFTAGARRIMVNSWNYHEFTSIGALPGLIPLTLDPEELQLGTGHPQGGNAISQSPERGVVDPSFKVHGWDNLYVCDASVIPSALTVNPQLTIMSLADYASSRIA